MSQTCDVSGFPAPPKGNSTGRQASDAGGVVTHGFKQGLKGGESPVFDQWRYLQRLVTAEYPYSTMYGVNIVDGNIVSCESVQRSLTFGPMSPGNSEAPIFDEFWEALKILCGRVRTGRLAELRFNHGQPVSAKISEGGRRFRRRIRTADEARA